ncbi:metallophosphoesterase [Bacteroides sp. AN502(2024)]|uniref:metallophosphoesterase n=1 Tax=Bacteroides sp. AN502(2024) TaxID=3160599 RepID=UPI003517EB3E
MKKNITLLLLGVCMILPIRMRAQSQHRFAFKKGAFTVAQFTDLHWTPQSGRCAETAATIRAVLTAECPDIAILTGDVVTADPALQGWKEVVSIFSEAKIPFVVTMGNHDAEYLTKNEIYDFLLQSPYYAGAKGPEGIGGCGNCVIPIFDSDRQTAVKSLLYCIDSNDYQPNKLYGAYDWIHFDQVAWYRKQSGEFTAANGGKPLPALAFFHIPLLEYNEIRGDGKTYGNDKEGGVASSNINSGMFASFLEMKDVMGIFAGHDHDNDYLGINKGILLGYGRVTGADAYGSLVRGARIIRMYENRFKFDTWIATAAGRETSYYYPSGLNSEEERGMTYLPAVKAPAGKRPGVSYTYYEGNCRKVADIDGCTPVKKGEMPGFSIKEAALADHFAYRFRTLIHIPERGVYRFYTYSDDGSVLRIDGKQVVDNDGGHSARRAEGKVALEQGYHHLELLYFEDYMGEELEVGYSGRNIPETVLPAGMLFLPD